MTYREVIKSVLNENDGLCLDDQYDKAILLEKLLYALQKNNHENGYMIRRVREKTNDF